MRTEPTGSSNEQVPGDNVGDEALVHGDSHILQEESSQENVHWGPSHRELGGEGVVGLLAPHICCGVGHCCEGVQVNGRALDLKDALQIPATWQEAAIATAT